MLITVEFLERFSYYGFRGIIILFAMDRAGLNIDRMTVLGYYGTFTAIVALMPFLMGIFSDFIFKQRNGVLIGGVVSLAGYLILLSNNFYYVAAGLALIAIGTGLVKTNIGVLIGRQYHKKDQSRNLAFVLLYLGLNLGAFFSILGVGLIAEIYGWSYGFGLTALATLLYLILFQVSKDKLNDLELNLGGVGKSFISKSFTEESDILDENFESAPSPTRAFNDKLNLHNFQPIPLVLITTLLIGIFWVMFELGSSYYFGILSQQESLQLFGFTFPMDWISSGSTVVGMIIAIILTIYWYSKGTGNTIIKFAFTFVLLALSLLLFSALSFIPGDSMVAYLIIPISILSLGEFILAPFAMSYITRITDVKYSSTVYGLSLSSTYVIIKFFSLIPERFEENYYFILYCGFMAFAIGVLLFAIRKNLSAVSGGIE